VIGLDVGKIGIVKQQLVDGDQKRRQGMSTKLAGNFSRS
jgi:hypothetical protein